MELAKSIRQMNASDLFILGARLTFGTWLFYVGSAKWLGGAAKFVGFITSSFSKTWIPEPLLLLTGWGILIAEPVIGIWLVLGLTKRWAWISAAALMFWLTFGQTVIKPPRDQIGLSRYLLLGIGCNHTADLHLQQEPHDAQQQQEDQHPPQCHHMALINPLVHRISPPRQTNRAGSTLHH